MMKSLISILVALFALFALAQAQTPTVAQLQQLLNEAKQNIPQTMPAVFFEGAIQEIINVLQAPVYVAPAAVNATKIDTHAHFVPDWYRAIVPLSGGSPTPSWNVTQQLNYMAQYGIARSILSSGAPGANACFNNTNPNCPQGLPNDELASIVIARLLNLYAAALCSKYPTKFSFYATVPLPYVTDAIAEATYAMGTLGAVAIGGFSNHEGLYIGNPQFTPFFQWLNSTAVGNVTNQIVFIHPNTPCQNINGTHIDSNPTVYKDGVVEFYFEDARAFMDLTLTETVHNFSAIDWIVPHAGGSFPSIIDRMLTQYQSISAQVHADIGARFWWDSAGATFPHQILGLLGYNISTTQLLFGTDFPYLPAAAYTGVIAAQTNTNILNQQQKNGLFYQNAQNLFAGKIKF